MMKRYIGYNGLRRKLTRRYQVVKAMYEDCASYDKMHEAAWPMFVWAQPIPRDDIAMAMLREVDKWLQDRDYDEYKTEALRGTY